LGSASIEAPTASKLHALVYPQPFIAQQLTIYHIVFE